MLRLLTLEAAGSRVRGSKHTAATVVGSSMGPMVSSLGVVCTLRVGSVAFLVVCGLFEDVLWWSVEVLVAVVAGAHGCTHRRRPQGRSSARALTEPDSSARAFRFAVSKTTIRQPATAHFTLDTHSTARPSGHGDCTRRTGAVMSVSSPGGAAPAYQAALLCLHRASPQPDAATAHHTHATTAAKGDDKWRRALCP